MSEIDQVLQLRKQWEQSTSTLGDLFDCGCWFQQAGVRFIDGHWWTDGSELCYNEGESGGCDEFEYASEVYGTVIFKSTCGDYTMIVADNGSGDRDCYVLKNCMHVEDY